MRLQNRLKIAGAVLLTGFLAACCGSGANTTAAVTPVAATSLEGNFGTEFAMIFDASSTATPTPLDSNSVPPLQPADKPVAFPT